MFRFLSQNIKNSIIPQRKAFLNQKIHYYFSSKIDFSKDYFKVLNVNQNANSEEIKKQYYKLVKQYHPDINKGNADHFKLINEAYEVLGDDSKRQEYITARQNPFQNDFSSQSYSQRGQQQGSYGQYYNYGNKKTNQYNYKRYEQTYYSTSQAQKEQNQEYYNQSFKNSKFYQQYNNSNRQNNDFEPNISYEEKSRILKKKIIAFSLVILGFYLVFDVLVYRILNTGPVYRIYDPESGQSFLADQSTFEQLQRRNYDTSFISPTDRDLQQKYGRKQNERYNYNDSYQNDTKK